MIFKQNKYYYTNFKDKNKYYIVIQLKSEYEQIFNQKFIIFMKFIKEKLAKWVNMIQVRLLIYGSFIKKDLKES